MKGSKTLSSSIVTAPPICAFDTFSTCVLSIHFLRLAGPSETHQTVYSVYCFAEQTKQIAFFGLGAPFAKNYQTYSVDFFCVQRHRIAHLSLFDVLRKGRDTPESRNVVTKAICLVCSAKQYKQ